MEWCHFTTSYRNQLQGMCICFYQHSLASSTEKLYFCGDAGAPIIRSLPTAIYWDHVNLTEMPKAF